MTHPLLGGLTTALGQLATDRVAGRQALTELWDGLDSDDAAGRCIIAHFLADAQDDLRAEIAWDETSLAESAKVSDDDLRAIYPSLQVIRFMPSLHLNLADGYRRLGRFDEARQRLASSVAGDSPLPERDPDEVAYREMILIGQQRIGAAIQSQNVAPLSG